MELTNTEYITQLTNTEGPCPFTINKETYMIRKVRAPERYLPNGKYNSKPLSPTYAKDYYARTRGEVECPHCSNVFKHKDTLRKHIKNSKKCILKREPLSLEVTIETEVQNDAQI